MGLVWDDEIENEETVCPHCGKKLKVVCKTHTECADMNVIKIRKGSENNVINGAIKNLTPSQMRDYIIRASGMATQHYIQSDTEMRRRIGAMLDKAIMEDDVMRGFLGYGGQMEDRDIFKNRKPGKNPLDD